MHSTKSSGTEIENVGSQVIHGKRGLGDSRSFMIGGLRHDVIDLVRNHTRQRTSEYDIALREAEPLQCGRHGLDHSVAVHSKKWKYLAMRNGGVG